MALVVYEEGGDLPPVQRIEPGDLTNPVGLGEAVKKIAAERRGRKRGRPREYEPGQCHKCGDPMTKTSQRWCPVCFAEYRILKRIASPRYDPSKFRGKL